MTGRKRKPTPLKILSMTSKRAEKLVKKITPTPGPLVDPPEWFTPEQREAWAYAVDNAPRDVLKKIDKSVLVGFIVAEDTHRRASIFLQQSQLLVKSPIQGVPQQNPYLPIIKTSFVLMLRAASELGFTPCSRARIDAGQASPHYADDWSEVSLG